MRTRRRLRDHTLATLAAMAAVIMLSAATSPAAAAPLTLSLVHVNDWDRMEGIGDQGGAARIATVAAEERTRAEAAGGLAVVTFGGDMISPSVLSGIDNDAHMIALANAIGFEVAVLGNHEFDFGPEVLQARLAESETVWLAGNVSVAGRGFPGTEATWTAERDGYRIGFLGLVTPETPVISSPGPDVAFAPVVEAGARLAEELRADGADIVIALTHQGLGADLELLRTVATIDVALGGHDHLLAAHHDGYQAVMKAGSQGRHVGVLTLTIDRVRGRSGTPKVVWTELPFGNKTVVLGLTGAQVREALENGVSRAEHPSGRFPQVSGLAFSFDTRRPAGARVTGVAVGGAALEDGRTYTLATNDFLARGGDGYTVFQAGEMLVDSASGTLMAGQLIDHIRAAGTVAPAMEGRIGRLD